MLQIKYKIWLDDGGKIFGPGPYTLLCKVRETGSLSEAAKSMGMSYNKAFNLIKTIEGRLGFKLIISQTGGKKGGGSQLTEKADDMISLYETLTSECEQSLKNIFDKCTVCSNILK